MPSAFTGARPALSPPRWALALAAFSAWAIAVPWIASAVGLKLDVTTRLEIIDHVVPGIVALACAAVLSLPAARSPTGLVRLGAVAVTLLVGVWITTTHIALIPDAADGTVSWGAALLHASAGPPIALLGLWLVLATPAR